MEHEVNHGTMRNYVIETGIRLIHSQLGLQPIRFIIIVWKLIYCTCGNNCDRDK